MSAVSTTNLTEAEILALLATKRRAERLRSLQRIASAVREREDTPARSGPIPARETALSAGSQADLQGLLPAPSDGDSPLSGRLASPMPPRALAAESPSALAALFGAGVGLQPPRFGPLRRHGGERKAGDLRAAVRQIPWGAWRDRALLVVEVSALVALIVVISGTFSSLGALNDEVSAARRASPPVAVAAAEEELPASSSPPASGSDLPVPLRSRVTTGMPLPIPTPGPQAATRIVVPAIGVDSVIVEGDTWEDLKKGVGHHPGSANPGERGNAVYSGHNDVYGEVFRRLEELKAGDVITMYAGVHLYRYEVKRTRIVGPKETEVMGPTSDATLTLITCYPYRVDTHRFVVVAKLIE